MAPHAKGYCKPPIQPCTRQRRRAAIAWSFAQASVLLMNKAFVFISAHAKRSSTRMHHRMLQRLQISTAIYQLVCAGAKTRPVHGVLRFQRAASPDARAVLLFDIEDAAAFC